VGVTPGARGTVLPCFVRAFSPQAWELGSMIALTSGAVAYVMASTIRGGLTIDAEDAA